MTCATEYSDDMSIIERPKRTLMDFLCSPDHSDDEQDDKPVQIASHFKINGFGRDERANLPQNVEQIPAIGSLYDVS